MITLDFIKIIQSDSRKELFMITIENSHKTNFLNKLLKEDFRFTRSLKNIKKLNLSTSANNLENLFTHLTIVDTEIYTLDIYPKRISQEVTEEIQKSFPNIQINPKNANKIISIIQWPREKMIKAKKMVATPTIREYFCGIYNISEELTCSSADDRKDDLAVCSASFKIKEAFDNFVNGMDIHWAIDVGAAPGGWTGYLVNRNVRVAAVDPAEMNLPKDTEKWIHIPLMAQLAHSSLVEFHNEKYDLLVCDMNRQPIETCAILLPMSKFIKEGGYLIYTLKFPTHTSSKVAYTTYSKIKQILSQEWKDFTIYWLFANTTNERTVFARKR